MTEINFEHIVPRCGGKREGFEELCCQLASRTIPEDSTYIRLHGAGGDGGIECFVDLQDGSRVGWQAKYVFDIGSLITQASASLTTALNIHPTLSRYVVCFPFDLTGLFAANRFFKNQTKVSQYGIIFLLFHHFVID